MHMLKLYSQPPMHSGIIYVQTVRECKEFVELLGAHGIKASCYNGPMSDKNKNKTHRLWMTGKLQYVVATVSLTI